jgi:hypothetical protein
MILLGDEAQVEAFSVCLVIVPILMQKFAHFALNVRMAKKSFLMRPIELLGDVGYLESRFDPFRDSFSVGA